MPLTQDDIKQLQSMGIDPNDVVELPPDDVGTLGTVKRRLEGNAGGIVGGGAGFMAGAAAGEPLGIALAPATAGISTIAAPLITGLAASMGGGYLGQKAQEAVLPDSLNQELAQQSAEAEQQHPYISAATDLTANMLASGMRPSLSNPLKAIRGLVSRGALSEGDAALAEGLGIGTGEHLSPEGQALLAQQSGDKAALQKVVGGAILNPAISTGISLAQGQGIPSLGDLTQQAAGGILFSEQSPLGRKFSPHTDSQGEPSAEPLAKVSPVGMTGVDGLDPDIPATSPYKSVGEDGQPMIPDKMVNQAFLKMNPKPDVKGMDDTQGYIARAKWEQSVKIPVEAKREILHQQYIDKQTAKPEPSAEPLKMVGESDVSPVDDTVTQPSHTIDPQKSADYQAMLEEQRNQVVPNPQQSKLVSQNILRIEQNKLLQPDIARPETKPSDLTDVDTFYPKTAGDQRTPEEIQQDRLEGAGDARYAPQSDKERYDAIQTRLKELTTPEGISTPEYSNLWKESEVLKNRNGGMPPVEHTINTQGQKIKNGWIDPQGVLHPTEDHAQFAVQQLGSYRTGEDSYGNMFKRGWTRIVHSPNGKWYAENGSSPSAYKSMNEAKQLAMENEIYLINGDTGKDIHVPKNVNTSTPSTGNIDVPTSLIKHLRSQQSTTSSVLQHFADEPNHPFAPLARELLRIGDKESLKTQWAYGTVDRSHYNPSTDIVNIAPVNALNARALMEEAVHSLSSKKLDVFGNARGEVLYNKMQTYLQRGDNEGIKSLIKAYIDTAKNLELHDELFKDRPDQGNSETERGSAGVPDETQKVGAMLGKGGDIGYAMGSLDEFLAHAFRTPEFQKALNEMPSGQPGRTMWQRVVDAVRHMLGLEVKNGSMLEHVLRTSSDIISQERPSKTASEHFDNPNRKMINAPKEDEHMGKLGMFTRDVISRVHDLDHEGAGPLADAAKQALNEQDALKGRWKNPIIEAGKKLTPADKQQINKVKDLELSTKQPQRQLLTTKAAQNYYDIAKKAYSDNGDYRIANQEPVIANGVPRLLKKDPTYWAGMANQKVEQVYRNNTDKPAIAELDKKFDDWNQQKLGMTAAQSADRIQSWKQSLQGDLKSSGVSHQDYFNASRKAMGSPLPPEFREQDPVLNDARYFDRQAIDNSHYKFIEKNPVVIAALGAKKDAWGKDIPQLKEGAIRNNPNVQALLHQFTKQSSTLDQMENSVSSLVTSTLISAPPIEVHKVISNQVKATSFADNPYQAVRMVAHALTNIQKGYQHAVEGNVMKLTAVSAKDMLDGSLTAMQRMMGVSKAIRNVATFGDLTTKFNAGLLQAQYEYLIPSKLQMANAGDKTAQMLIKRLDPTYTVGKTYTQGEQQQLASQLANYTHGTSDIRSMPAWMMGDSEISGFFKLAHWSVAQTNNFMHDVWTPARKGNIVPLVTSVFGSIAGGYIIKNLREDIQGKKSVIPSLTEIANSDRGVEGNAGSLAYNAIAAMQYSGFGGLLSQVAKYPFDFVYKNKPQGATFPLDSLAGDLVETFKNVSDAIANDPNLNWIDLASAVTKHVLSNNFQLSRIALNQGINFGLITGLPAEQKNLSDRLSQLRRFNIVEGLPYNEIEAGSNPYLNIEQKKYKSTQDINQAVQMLPSLIQNIMTKYSASPDVMMSKLKALKESSYYTFPSMESMPISHFKYLGYLQRMEGPEAAQEALQDYMKHKVADEVKSSIVP